MAHFTAVCTDPVPQVNIAAKCRRSGGAGIGINWNKDDNDPLNVSDPLIGSPTNNSATIQAAIRAVRQAKQEGLKVVAINTRNDKLINSMGVWKERWKNNNWKASNGKPVKNLMEIRDLMNVCDGIIVNWVYVNSDKDEGIVRAKSLAEKGAQKCESATVDELAQNLDSMHLNAGNAQPRH